MEQEIADLDMEYYFHGIESELAKANLDLSSRVFPDILITGLDKLTAENKSANSTKFNRAMFSHILDFKNLNKTETPILVSDFFSSFFCVYESMRTNRNQYGKHCLELAEKITEYKNEANISKESEKILQNGQTTNSKVKVELRDIKVYQDLSDKVDSVFKGKTIRFEYEDTKEAFLEVELNEESLNTNHEFFISDINKQISVSLVTKTKNNNQSLDKFFPRDCFDVYMERSFEIEDIGRVVFDIAYVNSKVNFYNKLVTAMEVDYQETHVHFDNLEAGIDYLEQPFENFMSKHNQDPDRRLNTDVDPKMSQQGKQPVGVLSQVHRKEIEVSENLENMLLNVTGKKCIVWENIFFLVNKIMLGVVVLVLLHRGDFMTVFFFIKIVIACCCWSCF